MLLDHVCGDVLFKKSGLKHLEIKFQKELRAPVCPLSFYIVLVCYRVVDWNIKKLNFRKNSGLRCVP